MRRAHEARQKLLRLGIFRQVDVVIDTSQGTVVKKEIYSDHSVCSKCCILLWKGLKSMGK
jgi:hypothetical protein